MYPGSDAVDRYEVLVAWLLLPRIRLMHRAAHISRHVHGNAHSHALDPRPVKGRLDIGVVEIIDMQDGKRMRLTFDAIGTVIASVTNRFSSGLRFRSPDFTVKA